MLHHSETGASQQGKHRPETDVDIRMPDIHVFLLGPVGVRAGEAHVKFVVGETRIIKFPTQAEGKRSQQTVVLDCHEAPVCQTP